MFGHLRETLKTLFYNVVANWLVQKAGRISENIASIAVLLTTSWAALTSGDIVHTKSYEIPWEQWNPQMELFPSKRVSVKDGQQMQIDVEVFVLSQEYNWAKGKSNKIQLDGESRTYKAIRQTMRHFASYDRVKSMNDIVLVGLASCEGDPERERRRAERRAKQLAVWFGVSTIKEQRVYSLSLGQYDTKRCNEGSKEANQRPVVILGTSRVTNKLDETAVRNALKSEQIKEVLPIDVTHYSDYGTFELKPHR